MSIEHDADDYALALDLAAEAFARAHPAAFAEMATFATMTYHGEPGGFARRMRALNREAATAIGFLSFASWIAAKYPQDRAA
jgi:hypothetical protein